MRATWVKRPLFRGVALRRLRALGAAGWVAGCANLIGLDDYSESDDPVSHTTGGDSDAGAGGASDAGAPGTGGRATGGRPANTGGKAPASGGAPAASGGRASVEGGEGGEGGEGPGPTTGGHRSTGGRRGGSGGEMTTGGTENTGGTTPTGGAPETGGTAPTTGGVAPTGGVNGTGGASVTSCALPIYPDACRACIDNNCNSRCSPCLDDADCRGLVACASGCFSSACLEGCLTEHEASQDAFVEIYTECAFTTCAATCGASFGASCDEDDECSSGTCSGPGGFCTALCDDHDDCPIEGWCAPDVDGVPRCLVDCADDELACPAGQHCGYVSTIDDYAFPLCTPLQALSEPCTSDDACHGYWCTGTVGSPGWCSNSCFDNLSCAADASCVLDSFGDPMCLLGCFDQTDCAAFPASECLADVDVEDNDVDICWL